MQLCVIKGVCVYVPLTAPHVARVPRPLGHVACDLLLHAADASRLLHIDVLLL